MSLFRTKPMPVTHIFEQTGFKTGDIVALNSGGPSMTVVSVQGSDVECAWFAASGCTREIFPEECLSEPDDDRPEDSPNKKED